MRMAMGAKTAEALHRMATRGRVEGVCARKPDAPNSRAKVPPRVSGAPNRKRSGSQAESGTAPDTMASSATLKLKDHCRKMRVTSSAAAGTAGEGGALRPGPRRGGGGGGGGGGEPAPEPCPGQAE